ncbi:MAG: hypothetical protein AVDCRST_MAG33-75 [uncultured Thermomicrobiales bacterium]|uniref:Uncharacterized protein n=1 Tax=uncultured Thermomicrobiales bacterium TaxID=1645740 RepID=A0A6J4U5X6_9BACT|nr:MAG: hypothetical protein AVDCRST_MAG33-75 [uncultured Thermomicrobiales bacterium]
MPDRSGEGPSDRSTVRHPPGLQELPENEGEPEEDDECRDDDQDDAVKAAAHGDPPSFSRSLLNH